MRPVLAITAAALLALAACSTDEPAAHEPPATSVETTTNEATEDGPIIEPFGEPLIGHDGKEVTIDSAAADGSQTTIDIRYKAGDEAIETYNILTPTLNYGEDGTQAGVLQLPDVNGVIVAGQSKVVSYPFDVAASELSEATLTVSIGLGEASWNGDLQAFIEEIAERDGTPTSAANTGEDTSTGDAEAQPSIWAPVGQGTQCP